MNISISTTFDKPYCFKCEKTTETINEKKERWKNIYILKGNCKGCNALKVRKNLKDTEILNL